jgi:hypothetical protein
MMAAMAELFEGTVTLLSTDIEGSTRLLERLGDAYADALAERGCAHNGKRKRRADAPKARPSGARAKCEALRAKGESNR